MSFPVPPHAYVPGQTPRHAPDLFEALHDSVRPGMTPSELAQSNSWRAGLHYLETGFFWEAHEALEPVWMALPADSAERSLVQMVIQLANAALKAKMQRPGAVVRLCAQVEQADQALPDRAFATMGLPLDVLANGIATLRNGANPSGIIMH